MADDRPHDDIPWYAPGHHRVGIPRQRQPGEEVWRLRDPGTARLHSCELHNDSKAGGGWDVTLLQDDELLLSRRSVDERGARLRKRFQLASSSAPFTHQTSLASNHSRRLMTNQLD